ncbi:MAG: TIGR03862 family flavoprotein [Pikeienuella sp.]
MTCETCDIAILGAGPAGLAAAEAVLAAGRRPVLFEAKPSPARKFLMAGKSGLNLTKAEPPDRFCAAFGTAADRLAPMLARCGAQDVVAWAEGLGEPLFTGSSRRVFPVAMKASPLLRKWLGRLGDVELRRRWRWVGWAGDTLRFDTPDGPRDLRAGATIMAFGGASWPRLGSDGSWVPLLSAEGVAISAFRPANMGFDVAWSAHFRNRFAGTPVKTIALSAGATTARGEFVITQAGIEGGAVYAVSAALRDRLATDPVVRVDLAPSRREAALAVALAKPRGRDSLANHLRKRAGIAGVKAGLLREMAPEALSGPEATARAIKALPLRVVAARPLAEAISSAGGVAWDALDANLMLTARPGVFCAGEMIDWEAPTGGYLLTACLATGFHAGRAAASWVDRPGTPQPRIGLCATAHPADTTRLPRIPAHGTLGHTSSRDPGDSP